MNNTNIPCPPPPRYGYSLYYNHDIKEWYYVKQDDEINFDTTLLKKRKLQF